jgi:hypothetical protein
LEEQLQRQPPEGDNSEGKGVAQDQAGEGSRRQIRCPFPALGFPPEMKIPLSTHIIHLETSETQLPAGTTDNQMYVYCTKSASFQAREPNVLINPEVLP